MGFLTTLTSYLPQHEGVLPQWLLFISITSLFNTVQCYFTLHFNSQIYNAIPKSNTPLSKSTSQSYPPTTSATPLSSRTFGTWTLITAIVRLQAAYHINNPQIYQLGYATFIVAWLHFMGEWLVFGTAKMGKGLAGPAAVSTATLIWMWMQWGFYVK
ncbi:3549cedd-204f-4280-aecb-d0a7cea599e0 [Sclerotinia trifoliorum]|uniref:3549cedd-204f-4280-aecb-d0a7cea599e0 n=1 Tax=Sclerotinia trifoliorum TaxID=28548 RepID=A0A8H2VYK4_9HELO|nr:3549cedd-204f-4280-aecb-d0a7cea599e0 [Sclerotinia trifoliorum]